MQPARASLGWTLCLAIGTQPMLAASPATLATTAGAGASARPSGAAKPLEGDERILHALNRFTFGPRPGDVSLVRQIGLDQWFERQLRPASFDYADLNQRLNEVPAMRLGAQELLAAFPSGAVIRQAADGKVAIPTTPILHAVYTDQIAMYEDRQAKKAEQQAPTEMAEASNAAKICLGRDTLSDAPLSEVQISALLALAPDQRIARLLSLSAAQLEVLHNALKGPQKAQLLDKLSPGQREIVGDLENPANTVVNEMKQQRLIRDVFSPAQLQEVMTDFWLNHFNVYLHKNEETPYYLVGFERDAIRPRALGRFEDLLVATARSPAMLLYLDNSSSMGPDSMAGEKQKERAAKQNKPAPPAGLNENYARELMELHTLGVNGGYTQADVTQMARVFTGWTVDQPAHGGPFLFDEKKHEPGTKKLLGLKVKESGENEGLTLLHALATRPATARFLSRKLAIRFVSDNPPQSLIDRMAKSYLSSDGDIATVLRTLFRSPEFWQSDTYRAKVKTPLEYVVSAMRASDAQATNLMPLSSALDRMGMPLYGCVPPTGYAETADAWVSTGELVNRMNFALALAANRLGDVRVRWMANAGDGELAWEINASVGQLDISEEEQRLEARLVQGGVSPRTRDAVLQQVAAGGIASASNPKPEVGTTPIAVSSGGVAILPAKPENPIALESAREKQAAQFAGLLLGSPEFQRR